MPSVEEIRKALLEIDDLSETVASRNAEGSDQQILAFAIHSLVVCMEDLADRVPEG